MNKKVDEVDEIYQFAAFKMRKQVDHEGRNKLSDLRSCSSKDARESKPSLQAVDAQLPDGNRYKKKATYSVTYDLEFLHRPKRH